MTARSSRTWYGIWRVGLVTILLVGGCCLFKKTGGSSPGPKVGPAVGPLSAGAAAVTITPSAGTPLAGFGGSPRRDINPVTIPLTLLAIGGACIDPDPTTAATLFNPATGTHDAIMARALVLANGLRKIAIVKLDTIGSSRKLRDDLVKIATPLGIPGADFVLLATHTHSGPGAVSEHRLWQLAAADCFADPVYQAVLAAASSALQQANAALKPAVLGIGTSTETLASKNRRDRPTIFDTELGVVKITTPPPANAPIAALFNFAVHGTSLGQSNMQFSADCMGEMERVVETGLPGAIAIFTNGAEGDVAPMHNGLTGIQQEGSIVGGDVVTLWPTVATKSAIDLRGAFTDVTMPPPSYNTGAGCMPVLGTSKTLCDFVPGLPLGLPLDPSWVSATLPFQAIRIDDTVFVAIPGEPITEIGWDLKARATAKGFTRGFVLGLANDHGGYFTTHAEYVRGEYEGKSTLYGPTTGQVVVDSADQVMSQVQ